MMLSLLRLNSVFTISGQDHLAIVRIRLILVKYIFILRFLYVLMTGSKGTGSGKSLKSMLSIYYSTQDSYKKIKIK